jgi:hypothetical protein
MFMACAASASFLSCESSVDTGGEIDMANGWLAGIEKVIHVGSELVQAGLETEVRARARCRWLAAQGRGGGLGVQSALPRLARHQSAVPRTRSGHRN